MACENAEGSCALDETPRFENKQCFCTTVCFKWKKEFALIRAFTRNCHVTAMNFSHENFAISQWTFLQLSVRCLLFFCKYINLLSPSWRRHFFFHYKLSRAYTAWEENRKMPTEEKTKSHTRVLHMWLGQSKNACESIRRCGEKQRCCNYETFLWLFWPKKLWARLNLFTMTE